MEIQPGQLITDGTAVFMVEDTRDGSRVGDIVLRHILRPGYVKANGAVLQVAEYPRLMQYVEEYNLSVTEAQWTASLTGMYVLNKTAGTLRVPDLRGQFLRALSDGSTVDAGRVIGSKQIGGVQNHYHYFQTATSADGWILAFRDVDEVTLGNNTDSTWWRTGVTNEHLNVKYNPPTTGSVMYPTSDTRPPNIAYIAQIKY